MNFLIENVDFFTVIYSISSVILSFFAIIISIIVYVSQNKFNKNSVRPYCNILLFCIKNELYTNVQNVGVGVMIVTDVIYIFDEKNYSTISEIIKNKKLKTCQEININEIGISPGSEQNIFKVSFIEQKDLLDVFQEIQNLQIIISFKDIYNKKYVKKMNFAEEYEVYMKALNNRKMEVFKNNYPEIYIK